MTTPLQDCSCEVQTRVTFDHQPSASGRSCRLHITQELLLLSCALAAAISVAGPFESPIKQVAVSVWLNASMYMPSWSAMALTTFQMQMPGGHETLQEAAAFLYLDTWAIQAAARPHTHAA